MLKKVVRILPERFRQELKRVRFGWQINRGTFAATELEFGMLDKWVGEGDLVLDVGANVGHYTARLAMLVGKQGRVLAFEPIPKTFELLAANVAKLPTENVTLMNAAVSDRTAIVWMHIPRWPNRLLNYYQAGVVNAKGNLAVMAFSVDSLQIQDPIAFVKIDVEGHELSVLKGMEGLLRRDHPVLVVEDNVDEVVTFLRDLGYSSERLAGSPNRIYCARAGDAR